MTTTNWNPSPPPSTIHRILSLQMTAISINMSNPSKWPPLKYMKKKKRCMYILLATSIVILAGFIEIARAVGDIYLGLGTRNVLSAISKSPWIKGKEKENVNVRERTTIRVREGGRQRLRKKWRPWPAKVEERGREREGGRGSEGEWETDREREWETGRER